MTETAHPFRAGDFLKETLVTDTVVWEVTAITAKTITVRSTRRIPGVNSSPWAMAVEHAVESDPQGSSLVRRLRKDGSVRIYDWSRPLRISTPRQFPEGEYHYECVDWSF